MVNEFTPAQVLATVKVARRKIIVFQQCSHCTAKIDYEFGGQRVMFE